MLAKGAENIQSPLKQGARGKAEHSGDHLLCSGQPHWRAHGSTYLPAERPIVACSLWRTPLGPGRFSHLRVRTTQAPGSNEATGATNS